MSFMGDILGIPDRPTPAQRPAMPPGPSAPGGGRLPQGEFSTDFPRALSKEQLMAKHTPDVFDAGMRALTMMRSNDAREVNRAMAMRKQLLAEKKEERLAKTRYQSLDSYIDPVTNVKYRVVYDPTNPQDQLQFPMGLGPVDRSALVRLENGEMGYLKFDTQGNVRETVGVKGLAGETKTVTYYNPDIKGFLHVDLPEKEANQLLKTIPRSAEGIFARGENRTPVTHITPSGATITYPATDQEVNELMRTRRPLEGPQMEGLYTVQVGRVNLASIPKPEMKPMAAVHRFVGLRLNLIRAKAFGSFNEAILSDLASYMPSFADYLKKFDYATAEKYVLAEMGRLIEYMSPQDQITYKQLLKEEGQEKSETQKFKDKYLPRPLKSGFPETHQLRR